MLKLVDKLVTLPFVVLRPVDRLLIPLVAVLKPVEVDVDSELIPADKLASRLTALLRPVDVEVDRLLIPVDKELTLVEMLLLLVDSWATVTASWAAAPSATLVMRRCAAAVPTETSAPGAAELVM